jgi:hypothetical protein
VVSTPSTPEPEAVPEVPQEGENGEPLWEQGTWSGLDQWTCLWPTQHFVAEGEEPYTLRCGLNFWSQDALMRHIRDDH